MLNVKSGLSASALSAIISFLSGLGWMLDSKKHRQEVEAQKVKTEVRVDTVYVEKRDSVFVSQNPQIAQKAASPFVSALKWICWIIIGLIGLTITVKVCLRKW